MRAAKEFTSGSGDKMQRLLDDDDPHQVEIIRGSKKTLRDSSEMQKL